MLGILLSLLILFFLDRLGHGLSMLHVRMLLLHDLIHKNGLVDSFGSIEARCAPSIPLNFVLVAQRNRTVIIRFVKISISFQQMVDWL